MKSVVVASTNRVKIASAQDGFAKMFPDEAFALEGVSAASDVADQPRSDAETLAGARNRARNAALRRPDADFWVGIEGGTEDSPNGMAAFAWVAVQGKDGRIGLGKTGTFFLPPAVAALVRDGMSLGAADDAVFGRNGSGTQNGAVGLLTGDAIDRTALHVPAVVFALIPFKNPDRYPRS